MAGFWNPTAWELKTSNTTVQLFAVAFVDATTAMAVGRDGTICTTRDGTTWSAHTEPTNAILLDVCFVDATTGWIVGSEDTLLATTDGGLTWQTQTDIGGSPTTANLSGVAFPDVSAGYAVGNRVLKYSP